MLLEINSLKTIYGKLTAGVQHARSLIGKPLTLTEKNFIWTPV